MVLTSSGYTSSPLESRLRKGGRIWDSSRVKNKNQMNKFETLDKKKPHQRHCENDPTQDGTHTVPNRSDSSCTPGSIVGKLTCSSQFQPANMFCKDIEKRSGNNECSPKSARCFDLLVQTFGIVTKENAKKVVPSIPTVQKDGALLKKKLSEIRPKVDTNREMCLQRTQIDSYSKQWYPVLATKLMAIDNRTEMLLSPEDCHRLTPSSRTAWDSSHSSSSSDAEMLSNIPSVSSEHSFQPRPPSTSPPKKQRHPCVVKPGELANPLQEQQINRVREMSESPSKPSSVSSYETDDFVFPPYSLTDISEVEDQSQETGSGSNGTDLKNKSSRIGLVRMIMAEIEVDKMMSDQAPTDVNRPFETLLRRQRMQHVAIQGCPEFQMEGNSIDLTVPECKIKGYEFLRNVCRGRRQELCQLFLACNKNNFKFSPVEVTQFKRHQTNSTAAMLAKIGSGVHRRYTHNNVVLLPPHPNLIMLLHRFKTPSWTFQVTSHVPWPTLAEVLLTSQTTKDQHQQGLAEDSCKTIYRHICLGLEHLHSYDVLHGDLSCYNVLVTNDCRVKLTGYGLCCQRMLHPKLEKSGDDFEEVYSPPEVRSRREIWTKSSDIWCLGVTLIHMCLGTLPADLNTLTRGTTRSWDVGKRYFARRNHQLGTLVTSLLKSRPSQRPSVTMALHHPWVSDHHRWRAGHTRRRALRTDGATFPLPKRVQRKYRPTSDVYYERTGSSCSDSDSTHFSNSPTPSEVSTTSGRSLKSETMTKDTDSIQSEFLGNSGYE